jgi:ribosomal protein S18 acetylase RimI-like enzyme
MQIFRKAVFEEEQAIFSLYNEVKIKGKKDGTSDWDEDYPNRDILRDDLDNKRVFVLIDEEEIIAAISIFEEDEPDIQSLEWTKAKACFLVRLCVSPNYQSKGIGEKMMRNINDYAKGKGFKATHHLAAKVNIAANRLYKRMGYRNVGIIHLYNTDFIAYEMIL